MSPTYEASRIANKIINGELRENDNEAMSVARQYVDGFISANEFLRFFDPLEAAEPDADDFNSVYSRHHY